MINETFVSDIKKEYQNQYGVVLPDCKLNHVINTCDYYARFNTESLYDKTYILNIIDDLDTYNPLFAKQILFHEFTHMMDAEQFSGICLKKFQHIMFTYSEFHASQIEMIERLNQSGNDIDLNTTNVLYVNQLSLISFMKQSFEHMRDDLIKMKKNKSKDDLYINTREIFYYYGKVAALQKFGIKFSTKFIDIPNEFVYDIIDLQSCLLVEHPDIEQILSKYENLEKDIILQFNRNYLIHVYRNRL